MLKCLSLFDSKRLINGWDPNKVFKFIMLVVNDVRKSFIGYFHSFLGHFGQKSLKYRVNPGRPRTVRGRPRTSADHFEARKTDELRSAAVPWVEGTAADRPRTVLGPRTVRGRLEGISPIIQNIGKIYF